MKEGSDKRQWKVAQIKRINTTNFIPRKNIDVVKKLLTIFKNHVGEENRISASKLFNKVYRANTKDVTDLQLYLLGNQLSIALSFMRQHTNCFVIREKNHLWVAKTESDFLMFQKQTRARIKGLENLQDRCENAIRERWWQKDFVITKQLKASKESLLLDNKVKQHADVSYLEGMSL